MLPFAAKIFGIVAALLVASVCVARQTSPTVDSQSATAVMALDAPRWYFITLNAVPAGWMKVQSKIISQGFRTETETHLRMAREKQIIGMNTSSWIEEDSEGRPLRAGQTQTGGGSSVRMNWTWFENGIRERRIQGSSTNERELPAISTQALPPMAAQRAIKKAVSEGQIDFSLLLLDPSQGVAPALNRRQKMDECNVVIHGHSVPCTRWKLSGPLIPHGNEEWIDSTYEIVQSQTPTGLGILKNVACDQATALTAIDDAKPPVEIMVASFVKVTPPLSNVTEKRSITYLVKAKKPPVMPPPQEGFQRVTRNPDDSFLVTINLDQPAEPSLAGLASDVLYMESSPMIDWKDADVLALKDNALAKYKSNEDAAMNVAPKSAPPNADIHTDEMAAMLRKAKVFRSVVANHIGNKNLGSAFANAGETARTKSGDCTEHAVLLAALLRAGGIPSRVAAGLVWSEYFAGEQNVFAWHLWTQALIGGRWIDLDSTLPAQGESFHVGHVLLAVTPLTDAVSDPAWASLLSSMGNLSIEVSDGANK